MKSRYSSPLIPVNEKAVKPEYNKSYKIWAAIDNSLFLYS